MTECKRSTCSNSVGQQDRDDYNSRKYCSIQCQTKHEHIKADARDAMASMESEADDPEGYFE